MSHGPEHQIEHAQHAAHASHDSFDKQVTISIAIVAAVLAAITMLGHRAHNETLQLQGEALGAQTQAGIQHNKATNMWGYYQATNIREHMYTTIQELSESVPIKADPSASPVAMEKLDAARKRWQMQLEKYGKTMPKMEADAKELVKIGESFEKEAKEKLDQSHVTHARGTRFDLGELGLQLGVVLCSLSILTKKRGFWLIGLLCSAVGLAVALTGVFGLFLGGGGHH